MTSQPATPAALDPYALERAAAAILDEALGQVDALKAPGARDRHRRQLAEAIALAQEVLAVGAHGAVEPGTLAGARVTLVKAHAARARDARHGAGQLSLGSQRAPTRDACDDGWQRVEEIVAVAEASARAAADVARELDAPAVRKAAQAADAAACDARRIVDARNHAYTFHTDPGFSFGEGWYVAAAALLAGVAIQLELDRPQTPQAARFLDDVGVSARLQPYRSRPRANKQLTEIVARAFRADPRAAQATLRAAFLGDDPIAPAVAAWTDRALAATPPGKKILLWIRHGAHHPTRNTTYAELVELSRRAHAAGLAPVLVGDAVRDGDVPRGAVDLTLGWKQPVFQGLDMRRAQLQLFEHLRIAHALVGQVGVTTAGMDGPALMGLPTMYLTEVANVRMGAWVGAIPGYQEVVRGAGYLERVSLTMQRWAVDG